MNTQIAQVLHFPRHQTGGRSRPEPEAPASVVHIETRRPVDEALEASRRAAASAGATAGQPGWLLDAISDGRVVVHYQPQYDMVSRRMVSAEALVRLTDTRGELHYPDTFIETAEESGLILALGRAVIEQVCRDLAGWRARGLRMDSVAINLSASQLGLDDMLEPFVEKMVVRHGLSYSDLEFEITERQQLDPQGPGSTTLRTLAHKGSSLALDDFGIGFSSISYLTEHPISTVKLDRSMVANVLSDRTTQRVIHHLLNMAKDLGLKVVAEGIETPEQDDYLMGSGCDLGQGFGFARPMPAESLARLAIDS